MDISLQNGNTADSNTVVQILLIERAVRKDIRRSAVVDRRQDELRRALRTVAVCKLLERLPGPPHAGEPVLNHVIRAWRMALETAGQARARFAGKIRRARSLIQATGAAGCAPEEAAAVLRFLETAAALPARLEEVYETERNRLMEMVDLDVLTYSERKAFRKGRQEGLEAGREQGRLETLRESAGRMRALGLDLATIARALGLSEDEAASLLTPPSSERGGTDPS